MAGDTLTQDDLNSLSQTYGQTTNLKVGDPLSMLVPSYVAMASGETNADQIKGPDPLRDKLLAGGYLMSASDTQGNPGWAAGPSYQASIDKMHPGGGTLPTNQSYAPTAGFGNFQNGIYNPGGLTNNIPIKNAYSDVYSDAKSSSWSGVNPVGKVDPTTGVQQYDWSKAVPHYVAGSALDRMIGPAIGGALGLGMGGLGMFGESGLGGLFRTGFNMAGNAVLGGKFNPLSLGGSAIKQLLPWLTAQHTGGL